VGRGDGVVVGIGVFVGAGLWVGMGVADAAEGGSGISVEIAATLVGSAARAPELAVWPWLQALKIRRPNSKNGHLAIGRWIATSLLFVTILIRFSPNLIARNFRKLRRNRR
jgi:hypothetical protein